MNRSTALTVALLAMALAAAPTQAFPGPQTGTVRLGVASPTPARALYNASTANNGLVGFVFALPSGSDGKTYTLKRVSGPTGLEDLDAYFYSNLDSSSGACDTGQDLRETGDTETGTICPNQNQTARYAVIVIKAGANTTFSFAVSA